MGGRLEASRATGKPRRGALKQAFLLFDRDLFGGRLAAGGVQARWSRSRRYFGSYSEAPKRILVSSVTSPEGALGGWLGILLHEMIHADLHLSGREAAEGVGDVQADHAEVFWAATRRVGRRLGLPDCSPEEAWAWPWCLGDGSDVDLGWRGAE
jgi:hypothetical protein